MSNFKTITPNDITDNAFKLIGKDWALVTAGSKDSFNTMTVSWGSVGIMWNKPVAFTFIRPQRYTFGFDEEFRKALQICGTKSGRDIDKVKETGLTPAFTGDGVPYFEEARLVLVCKKLYAQDLNEESIIEEAVKSNYSGDDYHRMYISEIVSVLKK